jgi:hypothetical protein
MDGLIEGAKSDVDEQHLESLPQGRPDDGLVLFGAEDCLDDERVIPTVDEILDPSLALVGSPDIRLASRKPHGGPLDFLRNEIGVDNLNLGPASFQQNAQSLAVLREGRFPRAVDARDQHEPRPARSHVRMPFRLLLRFTRLTANRNASVRWSASSGASSCAAAPFLPRRRCVRSSSLTAIFRIDTRPAVRRATKVHWAELVAVNVPELFINLVYHLATTGASPNRS